MPKSKLVELMIARTDDEPARHPISVRLSSCTTNFITVETARQLRHELDRALARLDHLRETANPQITGDHHDGN